jgi:2-oxoisovalerate dehydrogenase E2 component (dihydrolipoyl transacylase)
MTTFKLPDLGEGLAEAEIVTWHVSEGDHVIADQPLVSVETDKAVVEVPAPFAGTVARLLVAEGAVVKIGAPLVEIETGEKADTGAIVGRLEGRAGPASVAKPRVAGSGTGRAAPAVRELARKRGVDLADVTGTGPHGAILTRDVEAAASAIAGDELRGVRRAMAQAMAKSGTEVVPATLTDRADISDWPDTENPTTRLIRAIVAACGAVPALNAWFDGHRRQLREDVDLALAVDSPEGLFTPVLRCVQRVADIEAAVAQAKRSVQERTIAPEEMKQATITLSNFGTLGGEYATLVVSPPQVAILGAGRISEQCLVRDGQPAVRRILPLSLTFDHRVVTGGEAARFMAAVRSDLEQFSTESRD